MSAHGTAAHTLFIFKSWGQIEIDGVVEMGSFHLQNSWLQIVLRYGCLLLFGA
jgi:hypothetical protein